MRKKEILTALIKVYTKALKKINNNEPIGSTLFKYHVGNGICHASHKNFGVNITLAKWVRKEINYSWYWYECPYDVKTRNRVIECLEYRLNKMKQILKTCR